MLQDLPDERAFNCFIVKTSVDWWFRNVSTWPALERRDRPDRRAFLAEPYPAWSRCEDLVQGIFKNIGKPEFIHSVYRIRLLRVVMQLGTVMPG